MGGKMSTKEYQPEELKRMQETLLEIYKDIFSICKKYGIQCFACAGTELGTIRHQGFIPWDDDMDIGMLREDFDMFLKISQREYSEKYTPVYMNPKTDFPCDTIEFTKNGTTFFQEGWKKSKLFHRGISVDIFPYDYISDDPKIQKKHIRHVWVWNKLYMLRCIPCPTVPFKGIIKKIVLFACQIIHLMLKFLHISRNRIFKKYTKWALKYNEQKTNTLICYADAYPRKMMVSTKELFPLKKHNFCGEIIYTSNDYDSVLKRLYGDYMKLPPKEDRKNHFPTILDFGD